MEMAFQKEYSEDAEMQMVEAAAHWGRGDLPLIAQFKQARDFSLQHPVVAFGKAMAARQATGGALCDYAQSSGWHRSRGSTPPH